MKYPQTLDAYSIRGRKRPLYMDSTCEGENKTGGDNTQCLTSRKLIQQERINLMRHPVDVLSMG